MGKVSKWTISTAMNCLLEGCYIPSTSFHHLPFETNGFATQGSSRPSNLPRRPHTMQSQTRNLGSSKGWAGLGTLHSSNLTVSIYIYNEKIWAGPCWAVNFFGQFWPAGQLNSDKQVVIFKQLLWQSLTSSIWICPSPSPPPFWPRWHRNLPVQIFQHGIDPGALLWGLRT